MSDATIEVRWGANSLWTTLEPGERLDMFGADGSPIGTLVYGTPEEMDEAEARLRINRDTAQSGEGATDE